MNNNPESRTTRHGIWARVSRVNVVLAKFDAPRPSVQRLNAGLTRTSSYPMASAVPNASRALVSEALLARLSSTIFHYLFFQVSARSSVIRITKHSMGSSSAFRVRASTSSRQIA